MQSRERKRKLFGNLEDQIAKLEQESDHWKAVSVSSQQNGLGNALCGKAVDFVSTTDMREVTVGKVQEPSREYDAYSRHDHKILD